MRRIILACLVLLLAACAGGGSAVSNVGYYDFGPVRRADGQAPQLALRGVDVHAPSWLDTPALQYRIAYASDARRLSYAESRWVAQPAELLQSMLQRRLVVSTAIASSTGTGNGCRLRIDLDEFVQFFDKPTSSSVQLDVRASVLQAAGVAPLARQSFSIVRPTTTADAPGAIAAFGAAAESLTVALLDWLDSPAVQEAALRCKVG